MRAGVARPIARADFFRNSWAWPARVSVQLWTAQPLKFRWRS